MVAKGGEDVKVSMPPVCLLEIDGEVRVLQIGHLNLTIEEIAKKIWKKTGQCIHFALLFLVSEISTVNEMVPACR